MNPENNINTAIREDITMKKMYTIDPETGAILHGYIFADTEDNRYEAVSDIYGQDPEKVLEEADFLHSFKRGIIDVKDAGELRFVYSAYATPAAAKEYIARMADVA